MSKPREMTDDEVREAFLQRARDIADYWATVSTAQTVGDRVRGAIFSLLAEIDGSSSVLPAFALAPIPDSSDKPYHQDQGESWYPTAGKVAHDIGGGLHEAFYKDKQAKAGAVAQETMMTIKGKYVLASMRGKPEVKVLVGATIALPSEDDICSLAAILRHAASGDHPPETQKMIERLAGLCAAVNPDYETNVEETETFKKTKRQLEGGR